MKSSRLVSTTERYAHPAVERAPETSERGVRRVAALDAIEGDRQRSLREELSAAEADVVGLADGGEQARREARQVAAQLAELPPESQAHLTKSLLQNGFCVVDEKA